MTGLRSISEQVPVKPELELSNLQNLEFRLDPASYFEKVSTAGEMQFLEGQVDGGDGL